MNIVKGLGGKGAAGNPPDLEAPTLYTITPNHAWTPWTATHSFALTDPTGVTHIRVYRKTRSSSVYSLIATVPYTGNSFVYTESPNPSNHILDYTIEAYNDEFDISSLPSNSDWCFGAPIVTNQVTYLHNPDELYYPALTCDVAGNTYNDPYIPYPPQKCSSGGINLVGHATNAMDAYRPQGIASPNSVPEGWTGTIECRFYRADPGPAPQRHSICSSYNFVWS
jgi:hypothetical protein